LYYLTSGNNNVAVGASSLGFCLITGGCNVSIGNGALFKMTGNCNTAIGNSAGACSTSGNNNIFIGSTVQGSSLTVSNEVNIYNGINLARFQGSATAWTFVSDARDKKNIENLALGLEFIESLQPRKFEWNHRHTDTEHGKPASGFIAQEVLEAVEASDAHYANLVDTNDPEQYTLAQANLVPILVNAVKELSRQVKELQMYNARNSN